MSDINITASELAKALDIKEERLVEICNFFDSDPDDDWELIENHHFQWGPYGSRIFSPEGAIELCKYLDENEERPYYKRFQRWIFRRDQRLMGLMISKRVFLEAQKPGELHFLNGKAFLSPRSCRQIMGLGTRQDILNRTFSEIQRNENTELPALEKGKDFEIKSDFPNSQYSERDAGNRYFSSLGLASIGQQLGLRFSQKHRRNWAIIVAKYAPKAITELERQEADRNNRIKRAMDRVRSKAGKRCQITGVTQNIGKFNLEVHHIFDRHHYPKLADVEDNLIAISAEVHLHFHRWNGGSAKPCTIDDLEKFIEQFSDSLFNDNISHALAVEARLKNARKTLYALLDDD